MLVTHLIEAHQESHWDVDEFVEFCIIFSALPETSEQILAVGGVNHKVNTCKYIKLMWNIDDLHNTWIEEEKMVH